MKDIRAKAYLEKATRSRGVMPGKPAGWVICDLDTGKSLSSRRYPTEADADADIPTVLADVARRREAHAATNARQQHAAADRQDRQYKTVRSGTYGTGRVYADQPGATQYDDGSGTYGIQIWDNA